MITTLYKCLGIVPLVLCYLLIAGILSLLPITRRSKRGGAVWITSWCSRLMLVLAGVRVHVKHPERLHLKNGRFIIANHLSYVDVLVLSSLVPALFITSVELKQTFLLGILARLAGSIFVERRKAAGLKREIATIAAALEQGVPVVLFPEGTTSNGDRVMRFKNPLFDAAKTARTDILPLCIRYARVNGERVTHGNRDGVFYYGGVSFFKHVPRLLSLQSIDVEVLPLKSVKVHAYHSRKDLAAMTHEAINTAYQG